jgi:hypothetical protein
MELAVRLSPEKGEDLRRLQSPSLKLYLLEIHRKWAICKKQKKTAKSSIFLDYADYSADNVLRRSSV